MIAHRLLLMRLGLLEALSEEQVSAVQTCLRYRRLAAEERLFTQGEACEHLHVVQDGALRLFTGAGASGGHHGEAARTLSLVPPGQVLGEAGVFLGMPYPCSAEAAEPCQIASLHRDDLRHLTDRLPGFGWQLLRLLSRRLLGSQVHLQALASPDIAGRVGAVLLHLVEEATFPARLGQAGPVTVQVRQSEIAQMAGVSRETVSRLLTAWERDGIVRGGRGKITVNDAARLRQALENRTEPPPTDPMGAA